MRRLPHLASVLCLVLTGCAGVGAATVSSSTTPTPAPTAAAQRATPAASPTPATSPTPTATPAPPGALQDVASRPQCDIPPGTVPATGQDVVISIPCQELTAYQDGVPVLSTYVTTGEPALPTPAGHYHVLYRNSPFEMVTTWPPGTAGWYPPSWVQWVLWFRTDGYGIHDASWRPTYGPGTEAEGSHGCVNVPHDAMRQLYAWAQNGASVDVV